MTSEEHVRLAKHLDEARLAARSVERLTLEHPELSLPDGYAIQEAGVALRLSRGERQVGLKAGLTSEAKRKQMGLDAPVYGVLMDKMQVPDGGTFSLTGGIHPKIEPEIAFKIGRELRGKIGLEAARAACTGVGSAMEILDSRFRDFKYFSLPDVVADNASSSSFVISRTFLPLSGIQVDRLSMAMSVNGVVKQTAMSDAISGDPLVSLIQLCELLALRGKSLPAGSIVLAGAATIAEPLHPGDRVSLEVTGLPGVTVSVPPN